MKRLVSLICPFILFTVCFQNRALEAATINLDGLEDYVQTSMETWQVPGLSMAVVHNGEVVFSRGFGLRDNTSAAKVTPEPLFAIESSTKAFTTTALAMLVAQGQLSWDAPVIDYLPVFRLEDPWVTGSICLRDMLSHRTGLKGADVLWVWKEGALSREQLIRSMRYEQMAFPFRSTWHYNNLMFLTAGQVIPAVTGLSWDEFIAERIFTPLGMAASNSSVTDLVGRKNVASPHLLTESGLQKTAYRNIDMIAPAGAISPTSADMAKWLQFQLAGGSWQGRKLVGKESIQTMRSPQISIHPLPGGGISRRTFPGLWAGLVSA